MRAYICLLFIIVAFFGCKKSDPGALGSSITTNLSPNAFTVTVADRGADYAVINWTQAIDPNNYAVTYSVILGTDTVLSKSPLFTFKPTNLTVNAYHGKVIAKNSKGAAVIDTFYLAPFSGYFFGYSYYDSKFYKYTFATNYNSPWSFFSDCQNSSNYYAVYTTPAIVGDTVFVGEQYAVSARSLKTGAQYWSIPMPGLSAEYSLLYKNGTLYGSTVSQKLIAVNTATHAIKWIFAPFPENNSIVTDPIMVGTNVFICGAGTIFAVDVTTGLQKWSYKIVNGSNMSRPTTDGTNIYISSYGSQSVMSINAQTGALNWQHNFNTGDNPFVDFNTVTNVHDGVVIQTFDKKTIALNSANGNLLWQTAPSSYPGFRGDTVYLTYSGAIHALNIKTGSQIWQSSTAFDINTLYSLNNDIIVAGNQLYASRTGYYLTKLDAATGQVVASTSSYGSYSNLKTVLPVIVINDKAYYGSSSSMSR